jgi:hypothetical protein
LDNTWGESINYWYPLLAARDRDTIPLEHRIPNAHVPEYAYNMFHDLCSKIGHKLGAFAWRVLISSHYTSKHHLFEIYGRWIHGFKSETSWGSKYIVVDEGDVIPIDHDLARVLESSRLSSTFVYCDTLVHVKDINKVMICPTKLVTRNGVPSNYVQCCIIKDSSKLKMPPTHGTIYPHGGPFWEVFQALINQLGFDPTNGLFTELAQLSNIVELSVHNRLVEGLSELIRIIDSMARHQGFGSDGKRPDSY